jgi:hypothetical protein
MSRDTPPAAVAGAVARGRRAPDDATLERVRDRLRELRDLEREQKDREHALRETGKKLNELRHRTLPELFSEVGIDRLGLVAEGNLPAYDASEAPFYHANIASDWEPARREAAFRWLDDNGHGDLIKTVITVQLGRDEHIRARELRDLLTARGYTFTDEKAVPWNTLTAFVREQDQAGNTLPLEVLGATIGRVVKLKERK